MNPTRTALVTLIATLAAAGPAAAQTYETSAMIGEVDSGRVTVLASSPERITDRPAPRAEPVQRQAAAAPKGPVAAGSAAVLLLAFGLLVAPRRRGTS